MFVSKLTRPSLPLIWFYIGILMITPNGALLLAFGEVNSSAPSHRLHSAFVNIQFNDPRLELAIRNALGRPTGDIHDTDIAGLTTLVAKNDSIADLSGLEFAVNLQKLDFTHNRITELTPLLKLTHLDSLFLGYNLITDVSPLAELVNLSMLSLKSNRITTIAPLQNLVNLVNLELQDNKITDIAALQNLTALTSLNINNCKIVDLTPVQNLRALVCLRALDNKITDISPLQNLAGLEELSLSRNKISDFSPLLTLIHIKILYLTETGMTDLTVLHNLTVLQELYIANNRIMDLTPLQSLPMLKTLECYNNAVTSLAGIQNLPALQKLNAAKNRIGSLAPLGLLPALKRLDLSANHLKDLATFPAIPTLEILYLEENRLDHGDLPVLYVLDKLKSLRMRNNPGMLSGTAVQTLADSLAKLDCADIMWDGVCGIDPDAAVICWVEPDTARLDEPVTVQATATTAQQNRVQVKIAWGDGHESACSDWNANASLFTFTHTYAATGKYYIQALAQSEDGVAIPAAGSQLLVVVDNGAAVDDAVKPARGFCLAQNYPNPFNATTTIHYSLPCAAHVLLCVYNLAGQETVRLVDAAHPSGEHTLTWNGTTAAGLPAPSGVYLGYIKAGSFTGMCKMVLLR
ncbi:MAG TPA: leucine-rich repeat domain-containing protein [bacterium]|nr:leucine-rich repeat domain-containing protein [bacterium]HPN45116.1 leucine-rich repeat domain-containing protein [bacterium]